MIKIFICLFIEMFSYYITSSDLLLWFILGLVSVILLMSTVAVCVWVRVYVNIARYADSCV